MTVKVNCPIEGCGKLLTVNHLDQHVKDQHGIQGDIVLRLNPNHPYDRILPEPLASEQPAAAEEPGPAAELESGPSEESEPED